jgi:hypothetical protein
MSAEFWIFMGKAFAACIATSAVGGLACWAVVHVMGPTGEGE